jgi:hypothetical protein
MRPSPEPRFTLGFGYPPARRAFEPHLNGANFARQVVPAAGAKGLVRFGFKSPYSSSLRHLRNLQIVPPACTAVPESDAERMFLMIYFAYPINEEG